MKDRFEQNKNDLPESWWCRMMHNYNKYGGWYRKGLKNIKFGTKKTSMKNSEEVSVYWDSWVVHSAQQIRSTGPIQNPRATTSLSCSVRSSHSGNPDTIVRQRASPRPTGAVWARTPSLVEPQDWTSLKPDMNLLNVDIEEY